MMLMALMAGHEPDAQAIFDGMFDYFRAHPTAFHQHLMGSYQNLSCATPPGDFDSAADGDLDIALRAAAGRPTMGKLRHGQLPARSPTGPDRHQGRRPRRDRALRAARRLGRPFGEREVLRRDALFGFHAGPHAELRSGNRRRARGRRCATTRTRSSTSLQDDYAPATGLLPDFVKNPLGTPQPVGGQLSRGSERRPLFLQRVPRSVAARDRRPGERRAAREGRGREDQCLDPRCNRERSECDQERVQARRHHDRRRRLPLDGVRSAARRRRNGRCRQPSLAERDLGSGRRDAGQHRRLLREHAEAPRHDRDVRQPLGTRTRRRGALRRADLDPGADGHANGDADARSARRHRAATAERRSRRELRRSHSATRAARPKTRLQWKWSRGSATAPADLGDPTTTTRYDLCLYDGAANLVASAAAPAGGICAERPCWTLKSSGFRYARKDMTPNGLTGIELRSGAAGKARIVLKGKGEPLTLPALPIASLPLTVQLANGIGTCWSASFENDVRQNDAGAFKAKSD